MPVHKADTAAKVPASPSWLSRRAGKEAGTSPSAQLRERSSDLMIAALGIALGLTCALFPWYIFFNQDQFGIRAMKFSGSGAAVSGPLTLSPQAERVGAPMSVDEVPVLQLDLFATGTLPKKREDGSDPEALSITEQPFPVEEAVYRLVHVANGRAMIEDDTGVWVVQPGSMLPDNTRVAAIEQRDGQWVLVTTGERVIEVVR